VTEINALLTLALKKGEWTAYFYACFTPGPKDLGACRIENFVDPKAVLVTLVPKNKITALVKKQTPAIQSEGRQSLPPRDMSIVVCSTFQSITVTMTICNTYRSRHSDWLRAGWPRGRSSSPGRSDIFLFSTSSRPVLGHTQPPIQRVPGVKRPGCEANHSPPTSTEVKNT
jgi:hypothetical protein